MSEQQRDVRAKLFAWLPELREELFVADLRARAAWAEAEAIRTKIDLIVSEDRLSQQGETAP